MVHRLLRLMLALALVVVPPAARAQSWTGTQFRPGATLSAQDLNAAFAYMLAKAITGAAPSTPASIAAALGYTAASINAAPGPGVVTRQKWVFIGSVGPGFVNLTDPVASGQMLADGRIGLYMHGNGMAALTPAQRTALWATWGPTGVTATGQGQAVDEIGAFTPIDAGYLSYFGGAYAAEANMNYALSGASYTASSGNGDAKPGTIYTGYTAQADVNAMEAAIAAANVAGAKSVAVFMTPNGGGEDLDDPYATSAFWAPVRAVSAYGGGIALDVPPSYWVARGAPYQAMIRQIINYERAAGHRIDLTVSPYAVQPDRFGNSGNMGYDPNWLANTQALYSSLASTNSLPTKWIVENYDGPGGTGNDVVSDTTPGSLNEVALWLARNAAPQMQGITPAGSTGVADQGLLAHTLDRAQVSSAQGFQSVQQGTGPGQLTNNVKLGWDGANLRAAVDASDLGPLATQSYATGLYGGAWTSQTVGLTAVSGTLTSAGGTARYMKIGRTVFISISATIATNGTGATAVNVGLPVGAGPGGGFLSGRETQTGKMISGTIAAGGGSLSAVFYDNTYPGANGAVLVFSGVYEAAS